jgi:C4-dicarboxylate transporter DctQ subunit
MVGSLVRVFNRLEEYILWVLMLEMVLLSFLQVVLRYVFHTSFSWGEEVLRYQMVFVTFLGASAAVKKDSHISVTALVDRLPPLPACYVKAAASLVGCIFCFVLCYYSTRLAVEVKDSGQLTPALGIPNFIPYLFIPVGSFLMGLRFAAKFVSSWAKEVQ